MDVLCVGLGRTGTYSLKLALERLGWGPCYHMFELNRHPDRLSLWEAAANGNPVDWDEVFVGYRSTTDWPGAYFWRELTAAYPAAKVVLTTRDPERWYDSVHNTLYHFGLPRHRLDGFLHRLENWRDPALGRQRRLNQKIIWERTFGGRFTDRQYAINMFNKHIANVRTEVAADRLLVYEVADGWQPLCDFLGAPMPDQPLVRANDMAEFHRNKKRRRRRLLNPLSRANLGEVTNQQG
jgi:hypothetical protein